MPLEDLQSVLDRCVGFIYTNPVNAELITFDYMMAAYRQFKRELADLPKADPHRCLQCKEEMSKPAMTVGVDATLGYLCGRCAYLAKKEIVYDRRLK